MSDTSRVTEMYDRHPISSGQVLARLAELHGGTDGLSPQDLFTHDQDHYGGLEANDAIAQRAGLAEGMKIADFCAGLGGPARYFAYGFGVHVTGIDLNGGRVEGAEELNRLVGMDAAVDMRQGDVTATGLPDGGFDAVVSQEAFLHVPDKAAVIAEAHRLLKPGGRLVFTDWVVHQPLSVTDADILWQGLAAQALQSPGHYTDLLNGAGFAFEQVEDLTRDWAAILEERFAMYQALRTETSAAGLPDGEDAFYHAYVRLVALVKSSALGGGRFTAVK